MIALHTISFVIALLGSFHVQAGVNYTAAIQAALKQALFGLVWIDHIADGSIQRSLFFVGGHIEPFSGNALK